MSDKPEVPKVEVVYLGRRRIKGGIGITFALPSQLATLSDGDLDARSSVFKAPRSLAHLAIGAHYTADGTVEGGRLVKLQINTLRFSKAGNDARRMAWEASDEMAQADARAEAMAAKLKKSGGAMEANISALREAYHRTPWGDRRAFEFLVLDLIKRRP